MSSGKVKKTIIEGWLKKRKHGSSIFGNLAKRWFALDIVNATFTYSNGKNKKASKVIPLRDIENITSPDDPSEVNLKEWQFCFEVGTKGRNYQLYAPTKAEKEMWVHAFNTILKYKRKAEDSKKKEGDHKKVNDRLDDEEHVDFEEEEEEEEQEEEKHDRRDKGDYMGVRRPDVHNPSSQKQFRRDKEGEKDLSKSLSGEHPREHSRESEEERPKLKPKRKLKSKRGQKLKRDSLEHQEDDKREEQKMSREEILRQQRMNEEEMRKKMQPTKAKIRDSPELVGEDSLDSDSEGKETIKQEHKMTREERIMMRNKKSSLREKGTKPEEKAKKFADEDVDIELDIDRIVKQGPKETIKLEMPTLAEPKKEEENLPYFNGFTANAERKRKEIMEKKAEVIPPPSKKVENKGEEDLVAYLDRKYNQPKLVSRDVWGTEEQNIPKQKPKPKPFEPPKEKKYVENVLANQPKIASDDFEENWDSD
jgi:hypothetical protein